MSRRILVVELLGGIGDVVIALLMIRALGRSHPTALLTVLTFAPGAELLQADPNVHQVVIAKRGEARLALDALLTAETFDLIVSDTSYDGIDQAIENSGADRTVTNLWRSPPPDERVSDRFLKLLLQEGLITPESIKNEPLIYLTQTERRAARQTLGATFRPLVVLIPDAGMPIKRWSIAHFITVGRELQQRYGATIAVPIGSDPQQAAEIAGAIGAHVWPPSELRPLAARLAEADLVIAGDTGLARIAAALHVPTITLFGPSWSGRYGQPSPHINLQGYPTCSERNIANFTQQACWYGNRCPFDQWDTCLADISPTQVLDAVEKIWQTRDRLDPQPLTLATSCLNPQPSNFPNWLSVRNLLVMRLDNIGDVIMTTPTLRALRENLPDAKITLMASPGGSLTAPLLPWIDEVWPYRSLWQDLGRLDFNPDREWQLIHALRDRGFDAVIILTSFSQSPHPPALVCALAGIPLRLGESKEADLGTLTHPVLPAPDEVHQVDRNLRLIESVGFIVRDRSLCLQLPFSALNASDRFTAPSSDYWLLTPWTTCQSRNYDPDRFASAARTLSDRTGWPVVITGVEKDRDRAQLLLKKLGDRAIDLIGKTTLPELVALVATARLVLTNNTSTMHIADAMNTPNVVLFAGTEQECQWRPRTSRSRVLRRSTVCSPCYAFTCPYELQCLDISPDEVVQAGLALLNDF